MTSASGGILTLSDGTTTIDFYPATNAGWHVAQNGLSGFGAGHISYQMAAATPQSEGSNVVRKVIGNRPVRIVADLVGTSAADIENQLSALSLMIDNGAEYARTRGAGSNASGSGVKLTLTYTLHGNGSVNVAAMVISGHVEVPTGYASAATYPALNLNGITIDLQLEPYWTDTTLKAIHNLLPDLSPFGSLTGWTGSTGSLSLVTGPICGPYAVRVACAAGTVAFQSPPTAVWAASSGGIYVQYWAKISSGSSQGMTVRLQEYISGVWTDIGAGISPVSLDTGWNQFWAHGMTHSGNQLRLSFTTLAGQAGKTIDITGMMVAISQVAGVPTDLTVGSVITTSYTMQTNGDDLTLGSGTPPAPSKVSGFYVRVEGQLSTASSSYTLVKSDAPPQTYFRFIQQATGSGNQRHVWMGRRSSTGRDCRWVQREFDQTTSGYTAGTHVTVDSTSGGTGGNWGNKGNSLKFTPTTVGTAEMVARWDLNNLALSGSLPGGRWRVLLRLATFGVSSTNTGQEKFDWWIESGANSAATTQRTQVASVLAAPPNANRFVGPLDLGQVDFSFRYDPTQFVASHFYLTLKGVNRRGLNGDSAWVDSLVLIPIDEGSIHISEKDTTYLSPTTGQSYFYDGAARPPYVNVVDVDGATVLDVADCMDPPVQLQPGDNTYFAWQSAELNNVQTVGTQQLVEVRVRRRWLIPRT